MRTRSWSVVLGALCVLTLVAPAAPASAAPADDVPIAEAGTIQASDLPSSFTETSAASSREGVAGGGANDPMTKIARTIPQCKGFVAAFGAKPQEVTASSDGASFDSDSAQASGSVLVFATEEQAQELFVPLSQPSLATCLNRLFEKSAEKDVEQASGSGVTIE